MDKNNYNPTCHFDFMGTFKVMPPFYLIYIVNWHSLRIH